MNKICKSIISVFLVCLLCVGAFPACGSSTAEVTLTNVSYDPTRELYEAYNKLFAAYWLDKKGQTVTVTQSHGGSGSQALAGVNGLEADVVTLALEADVQSIAKAGLINDGWINEFGNDSSPYTSTIVFVVRAGNPKGIKDWNDLTADGVGVITPNPKTSGGARWNFLAAWAYAENLYNNDDASIKDFMKKLYGNVLVLDSGARGSTNTFSENGQGDVLIAWENEAFLLLKEYPDKYEMVTPSVSILCQPSVAIVDKVADARGTQEVAKAYLDYLYSDDAQRLIAENYYRPSNKDILNEYKDVFNLNINMVDISHFGGWTSAQSLYFSDGGIFDQIYDK
jgi:sulfate/thiosulfate-binding protein